MRLLRRRVWDHVASVRREESGQATLFLALVSLTLALFLMFELNALGNVNDRIQAQNAADAAAIAEADWIARGMNLTAMGNIGMAMTFAEIMMVEAVYHTFAQGIQVIICEVALVVATNGSWGTSLLTDAVLQWSQLAVDLFVADIVSMDGPIGMTDLGSGDETSVSRFKRLRDSLWHSFDGIKEFQGIALAVAPRAGAAWCHLVGSANQLTAAVAVPADDFPLEEGTVTDLCWTTYSGNPGGFAWTPDLFEKMEFFFELFAKELIDEYVPSGTLGDIITDAAGASVDSSLGPAGAVFNWLLGELWEGSGLPSLEDVFSFLAFDPSGELHAELQDLDVGGLLEDLFGEAGLAPVDPADELSVQTGPLWTPEEMLPFLWVLTRDHLKWGAPFLWFIALLDTYWGYCDGDSSWVSPFRFLTCFMFLCIGIAVASKITEPICIAIVLLITGGVIAAFLLLDVATQSMWDLTWLAMVTNPMLSTVLGMALFPALVAAAVYFGILPDGFSLKGLAEAVLRELLEWLEVDSRIIHWYFEEPIYSTYPYRTEEGMELATPLTLEYADDVQMGRLTMARRPGGAGFGRLAPNLFKSAAAGSAASDPLYSGQLVLAEAEVYNAGVLGKDYSGAEEFLGGETMHNAAEVEAMFVPQWRTRLRPCTLPSSDSLTLGAFTAGEYGSLYGDIGGDDLDWFEQAAQRISAAPEESLDYMLAH